ncbi:MAG: hypothetical protein HYT75_06485 [Deltaproteobacteria bacterium]|nr:hypothetical protein [Deltaproteobacteria bacterium]
MKVTEQVAAAINDYAGKEIVRPEHVGQDIGISIGDYGIAQVEISESAQSNSEHILWKRTFLNFSGDVTECYYNYNKPKNKVVENINKVVETISPEKALIIMYAINEKVDMHIPLNLYDSEIADAEALRASMNPQITAF